MRGRLRPRDWRMRQLADAPIVMMRGRLRPRETMRGRLRPREWRLRQNEANAPFDKTLYPGGCTVGKVPPSPRGVTSDPLPSVVSPMIKQKHVAHVFSRGDRALKEISMTSCPMIKLYFPGGPGHPRGKRGHPASLPN
jgi:hypothetical protein